MGVLVNTTIFPMLTRGLFLDGMIYGILSKNMDYSSLWSLYLNNYDQSLFYEHPPFMFWLQGLYFKLFGDGYWVEHVYALSMLVLVIVILRSITKKLTEGKLSYFLLFLCLLFCAPIVPWSFANNMLENTTLPITLCGSYLILSILERQKLDVLRLVVIIFLFLIGFLTKGPVCLFPLAIPVIYTILYPARLKNSVQLFVAILLGLILIAGILYAFEGSSQFLAKYLDQQILAALKGERVEVADSRLRTFKCLLNNNLSYIILVTVGCLIFSACRKHLNKQCLLYALIGLSGSLPLLLTKKQACIYIMPVLPYFLMAMFPIIRHLFDRCAQYVSNKTSIIVLLVMSIVVSILCAQNRQRHVQLDKDAQQIQAIVPANTPIHLEGLCFQYDLKAYFARYDIADGSCNESKGYLISTQQRPSCKPLATLSVGTLYWCE